jgi:hypothetical protein
METAVLLHHVADAAAQAFNLFAAIVHRAGIGFEQAGDDVEDRGLAAAAGADDADEVAVVDVKAEVVEHSNLPGLAVKGFSTELGRRRLHCDTTRNLCAIGESAKSRYFPAC